MYVRSCLPLDHLDRLTDSTGLIQHAIYSLPRRESGYTTDDNARALRLCARLWSERPDERMLARVACYLSFLEHARCPVRGFHNFLSYQRDWLDAAGTGDCAKMGAPGREMQTNRMNWRINRDLSRRHLPSVGDMAISVVPGEAGDGIINENGRDWEMHQPGLL